MSVKEEVIRLVDSLSPDDLLTARRVLRGLLASAAAEEASLRTFIEACPLDDEDETPEERAAVERAWDEYRSGHVLAHEEVVGTPAGRRPK